MIEVDPDLRTDIRWQLIERITASPPFQKSTRLRDLLRFMAERTLHGQPQDLTEHRIGSAVFGKPQDYSVVEDSSVSVHVRQLRLKLHEYFDGEGREEPADEAEDVTKTKKVLSASIHDSIERTFKQ